MSLTLLTRLAHSQQPQSGDEQLLSVDDTNARTNLTSWQIPVRAWKHFCTLAFFALHLNISGTNRSCSPDADQLCTTSPQRNRAGSGFVFLSGRVFIFLILPLRCHRSLLLGLCTHRAVSPLPHRSRNFSMMRRSFSDGASRKQEIAR